MGLFESPEKKWIKSKQSELWNKTFSDFTLTDAMITKLMVWESVDFADRLARSDAFRTYNQALHMDAVLLAKMQFFHLVTKSPTIHNLFYGYLSELWTNVYKEDAETVNGKLESMHKSEKWFLWHYYDFYDRNRGELKDVLKQFCKRCAANTTTDGDPVLAISTEELQEVAARELLAMHRSFLSQIPASLKP